GRRISPAAHRVAGAQSARYDPAPGTGARSGAGGSGRLASRSTAAAAAGGNVASGPSSGFRGHRRGRFFLPPSLSLHFGERNRPAAARGAIAPRAPGRSRLSEALSVALARAPTRP